MANPDMRTLAKRQQASRDEILRAAADAFTTRGYSATSIDDVAERLECTKGRVYHYFKTKGELFLAVHRRAMEMVISNVVDIAAAPRPAPERLHDMVVAHARLLMEEYAFTRAAVQHAEMAIVTEGRTREEAVLDILALRDQFESLFETVIIEGIEEGAFRAGDPHVMVKAALGAVNWIAIWFRPSKASKRRPVQAIADEFGAFVLGAVSKPSR